MERGETGRQGDKEMRLGGPVLGLLFSYFPYSGMRLWFCRVL
jgi:hypothetical protein